MKDYRLYFTYTENGGYGYSLDDESYSRQVKTVKFHHFYKTPPDEKFFYDSIELSESDYDFLTSQKFLYLAVIRYTDGGTFGETSGYWYIAGVSDTEEGAQRLIQKAYEGSYKPWVGHFASFDDEEIHILAVKE